jgi:ubiquinone/menaquinone biosynthesis C-methylase UbiE
VATGPVRHNFAASIKPDWFHEGEVEALPFDASSFEKVITVNTVYFWKSLDQGFRQCYRVLASTGLLVVGFLPKDRMDRMGMPLDIFTSRTPEQMVAAIEAAGFVMFGLKNHRETHPGW